MSDSAPLPDYASYQELEGCRGPVNVLLFSPDGKLLISGGKLATCFMYCSFKSSAQEMTNVFVYGILKLVKSKLYSRKGDGLR